MIKMAVYYRDHVSEREIIGWRERHPNAIYFWNPVEGVVEFQSARSKREFVDWMLYGEVS